MKDIEDISLEAGVRMLVTHYIQMTMMREIVRDTVPRLSGGKDREENIFFKVSVHSKLMDAGHLGSTADQMLWTVTPVNMS